MPEAILYGRGGLRNLFIFFLRMVAVVADEGVYGLREAQKKHVPTSRSNEALASPPPYRNKNVPSTHETYTARLHPIVAVVWKIASFRYPLNRSSFRPGLWSPSPSSP